MQFTDNFELVITINNISELHFSIQKHWNSFQGICQFTCSIITVGNIEVETTKVFMTKNG